MALFAVAGILELGAWTESPEKELYGAAVPDMRWC